MSAKSMAIDHTPTDGRGGTHETPVNQRVSDAIYGALCGQLEAKHGGKWVAIPIEPTDKTETK